MLDIKEANRFIIFIFLLLLFIAATNNYTSIENSMIDGFSDQKHYLNIINDSPSFTIQEIAKYQSERFFFPYVIGALINFFKLNQISYEIFIFLNIAVFFLILSLFISETSYAKAVKLNCSFKDAYDSMSDGSVRKLSSNNENYHIISQDTVVTIDEARKLGINKISIETGAGKFFEPARKLFKRCNFEPCKPFAHYKEDINSIYLTKLINNE